LENALFSLVKLVLLVALAVAAPVYGIFASWTAAVVASLVPVNLLVFARLVPRAIRVAERDTLSVTRTELARYVAADYAGAVAWLAMTTLPPIIVAHEVGAEATAYFSLAWVIAFPIYFVPTSIGSSLVVHAVRDRERLPDYARQAAIQSARLLLPAAVALAVAGPFLLRLLGHGYEAESSTVLRLLVVSAIPNGINILYVSVARVERRMSRVVAAFGGQAVIALGLAVPFVRLWGIVGLAVAWLLGQAVVAVAILVAHHDVLVRAPAGPATVRSGA
jgi:O-antigen/teichoic acid export membrane protein